MGILDYFKNRKEKKQIDQILDKVSVHQQAKDLVNKAIAYRSINEMQKAIETLEIVLDRFPEYRAANQVYGNTLRKAGMIDDAITFFKSVANKDGGRGIYCPQEIYANLGSIYYFEKIDLQKALQYYKLGLEAPQSPSLHEEGNKVILSGIHCDLAVVFFDQSDYVKAKNYAMKRLEVQKKCPIATKILGLSLINEFLNNPHKMKFFSNTTECPNIESAIKCFKLALGYNDEDYGAIGGLAIAYYLLSQMPYYIAEKKSEQHIGQELDKYFNILEKNQPVDKQAEHYFNMYNEIEFNMGSAILKHKYPNISISYDPPEK